MNQREIQPPRYLRVRHAQRAFALIGIALQRTMTLSLGLLLVLNVGEAGLFIGTRAAAQQPVTQLSVPQVESELPSAADLRIDQLQIIGTHNSYHVAPDLYASKLIGLVAPQGVEALSYTHPTLTEQFERLGVRQIELDLYRDDQGGRYAEPLALKVARDEGVEVPEHDPTGQLQHPGIKILHSPDFDYRTQALTLTSALGEIVTWSAAHRDHVPIFVLLELKDESYSPTTRPEPWNAEGLKALEQEILSVLPRDVLFTPQDLQQEWPSLRVAVQEAGWPTLRQMTGKVVLLLDNQDAVRDEYLRIEDQTSNRLIFVSVDSNHPSAAWMKINDPIGSLEQIQRLVGEGFLIRTRADSELRPRRQANRDQYDAAIASGAQLISTDFADDDPLAQGYRVRFGEGVQARIRKTTHD